MAKIMVVDDQKDWTRLIKKILEKFGHNVVEAHSGTECLTLINDERPDLIFMDIDMYDISGWETCKEIKENPSTASLSVCMLSSNCSDEDIQKSFEYAHADEHLAKTIDLDKFMQTVSVLLNGKMRPRFSPFTVTV